MNTNGHSFEVGELCFHRGFICRVDGVGQTTGADITLTPLYHHYGERVANAKTVVVPSGQVGRVEEEIAALREQIEKLQQRLHLLENTRVMMKHEDTHEETVEGILEDLINLRLMPSEELIDDRFNHARIYIRRRIEAAILSETIRKKD